MMQDCTFFSISLYNNSISLAITLHAMRQDSAGSSPLYYFMPSCQNLQALLYANTLWHDDRLCRFFSATTIYDMVQDSTGSPLLKHFMTWCKTLQFLLCYNTPCHDENICVFFSTTCHNTRICRFFSATTLKILLHYKTRCSDAKLRRFSCATTLHTMMPNSPCSSYLLSSCPSLLQPSMQWCQTLKVLFRYSNPCHDAKLLLDKVLALSPLSFPAINLHVWYTTLQLLLVFSLPTLLRYNTPCHEPHSPGSSQTNSWSVTHT